MDDPGIPFVPPEPGPARTYDAVSKTAMAFTPGVLTLTPTPQPSENMPSGATFAFGNGIKYETTLMPGGAMQGEPARLPKWADVFQDLTGAPIDPANVVMYAIDTETIPPNSPNGGLCKRANFLATYTVTSAGAEDFTIAAFEGDDWPPASGTALCGTFTYSSTKP